jgi:hypothetical protein
MRPRSWQDDRRVLGDHCASPEWFVCLRLDLGSSCMSLPPLSSGAASLTRRTEDGSPAAKTWQGSHGIFSRLVRRLQVAINRRRAAVQSRKSKNLARQKRKVRTSTPVPAFSTFVEPADASSLRKSPRRTILEYSGPSTCQDHLGELSSSLERTGPRCPVSISGQF